MNTHPYRMTRALRRQIARLSVSTLLSVGGVAAVVALTVGSSVSYAQSNTNGYIYGEISGASSVGLTVVAVNENTGLSRSATPNTSGAYQFSTMPVGNYTVSLMRGSETVQSFSAVPVNIGTGRPVRFDLGESSDVMELEKFEVSGSSISPIDVSQAQTVTVFRSETIDILPVARNLTAVALLAPGTTQGDEDFGNLASFGGATVGENAFYINGFNVTNFRNGLGGGTVPFEFYDEFQILTGGYGAEFGRSTGGVINTVTKRGGNEWKGGIKFIYEPASLGETRPSSYDENGDIVANNREDKDDLQNTNIWFSGAIVPNHLFIYALYQQRQIESEFASGGTFYTDRATDPFWGVKLDYQINDDHLIELTRFSDKRSTTRSLYSYDPDTREVGAYTGDNYLNRGGNNIIARYVGTFAEDYTLAVLYGKGSASFTDAGAGDAYNYILDSRVSPDRLLGQATSLQPGSSDDEREAFRVDGTISKFGHVLKFGFDQENNTSNDLLFYSGGNPYWRYYNTTPGSTLPNGGVVPAGATQYVRERVYENGGSFEVKTNAIYIEDSFKLLNDKLFFTIGLRNESFDNKNANGDTFIKVTDQLAPRLAVGFDPKGDGTSKIFANYGRYYLPIASNTNIRLAGAELFTEDFFVLNGLNADDTPIKGAQIGGTNVYSDGSIKDVRSIVDQNIEPMYQDEYIVGYQTALGSSWSLKVYGTYRDLLSTIEDVAIDAGLLRYAAENGYTDFDAGGFDYYVLTNPGGDMKIFVNLDDDLDGDGIVDSHDQSDPTKFEEINLSATQLGYPESSRKYYAGTVELERIYDGKWGAQMSYTWAHSYGNNEGFVRSDNDQTDAGLTTLFDQPGLLDGAYGNLPNDRRHSFKAFGVYKVAPEWRLSSNFSLESGRAINAFGVHPTDAFAAAYGSESFYADGVLVPRGSKGTTAWVTRWDLGVEYKPKWGKDKIVLSMDIFNVLNLHSEVQVDEIYDEDDGSKSPSYGVPTRWQQPRYFRFSAEYAF